MRIRCHRLFLSLRLLLVLCLLSETMCLASPINDLSFQAFPNSEPVFTSQALSLLTRISGTIDRRRAARISRMNPTSVPLVQRRSFIRSLAAISLFGLLKPAQTTAAEPLESNYQYAKDFQVGREIPDYVQQLIQEIQQLTKELQMNMYSVEGIETQFNQTLYNEYKLKIVNAGYRVVLQNLRTTGRTREADALLEQLKSVESEKRQANFLLIFHHELPSLFAQYGYWFTETVASVNGAAIPEISLEPLQNTQTKKAPIPVLNTTVEMRIYYTTDSIVRRWHQWKPEKAIRGSSTVALPGSNVLMVNEVTVRAEVEAQRNALLELANKFPSFAQGQQLSLKEVVDPWERLQFNLQARAIFQYSGKQVGQLTAQELDRILEALNFSYVLLHEAVHVFDIEKGTFSGYRDELKGIPVHEVRAGVASAIQQAIPSYATNALIPGARMYLPGKIVTIQHGPDNVFILRRLAFWHWKNQGASGGALNEEFESLPQEIQVAILDQLPTLNDQTFWNLYQNVWHEITAPKERNPMHLKKDQSPLYEVRPHSDSTMDAPQQIETPFYQKPFTLTVAFLALAATASVWFLKRKKQIAATQKTTSKNSKHAIYMTDGGVISAVLKMMGVSIPSLSDPANILIMTTAMLSAIVIYRQRQYFKNLIKRQLTFSTAA